MPDLQSAPLLFDGLVHFNVYCRGDWACFGRTLNLSSSLRTVQLECQSENSCSFGVLSSLHLTDQPIAMNVRCIGDYHSCVKPEWSQEISTDVSSVIRNITYSRMRSSEVTLVCTGHESCASEVWFAPNLSVVCKGNDACVGAEFGAMDELSVLCSDQGNTYGVSCDRLILLGHCANQLTLTLDRHTDISDSDVFCPAQSDQKKACLIAVDSGGSFTDSSIAMRGQDWSKARFTFKGHSEAFVRVTTEHMDTIKGQCEWAKQPSGQVVCFVEEEGDSGEWAESTVCTEFVMSVYSPESVIVLSVTALMGSFFILAAVRSTKVSHSQVRPVLEMVHSHSINSGAETPEVAPDIHIDPPLIKQTKSATLMFTALLCISALCTALYLQSYESSVRSALESSSDIHAVSTAYYGLAAWFLCCINAWLTSYQLYLVHSEQSLIPILPMSLASSLVCICDLRMIEMIVVYIARSIQTDLPLIYALALFMGFDVLTLVVLYKPAAVSAVLTLVLWLCLSQFSPAAALPSFAQSRTFFQVVMVGSDAGDWTLIWFDLAVFSMVFGIALIIADAPDTRTRLNANTMFTTLLDYATDIAVLTFWLANGQWLWASALVTFLTVSNVVQWLSVQSELPSEEWIPHVMILTGLGRGYTKLRLWESKTEQWNSIDRRCSKLEAWYESYPSLFLGLYLLISDQWAAYLNDEPAAGAAQTGPLMFSVICSALSVGLKAYGTATVRIVQPMALSLPMITQATVHQIVMNVVIFMFCASDFLCRVLPECLALALAQGSRSNSESTGSMVGLLFAILIVGLCMQTAILKWCIQSDTDWVRNTLALWFPSLMTGTTIFFDCFPNDSSPLPVFQLDRFFRTHWLNLSLNTVITLLCLSIEPAVFSELTFYCLSFFGCWLANVCCGLTLQFLCRWETSKA